MHTVDLDFRSTFVLHTVTDVRAALVSVWIVLVVVATGRVMWAVGTFVQIHVSLVAGARVIGMHLSLHSNWLSRISTAHWVLWGRPASQILLVLHLMVLARAQRAVVDRHQDGLAHGSIPVGTIGILLHAHNYWVSVSHSGISHFRDVL